MSTKPILHFELTRNRSLSHYEEVNGPMIDSREWDEPMPEKVDMGYDYVEFELLPDGTIRGAQYPGGGTPFWWKPDYVLLKPGSKASFYWEDTEDDHDGTPRDGDTVILNVHWPDR